MSKLFYISKLEFSYNTREIILKLNDITINHGHFVILVGNSGSGKSTLLEILGLMKSFDTSRSNSIVYYPSNSENGIDFNTLWDDNKEISKVRNNYFSFMFQHPDMIPHLFVDENINISQLIQEKKYGESLNNTYQQMNELGIGHKIYKIFPNQLSGGQLQRASFARAILPDHEVIFGDELTGNLGEDDSFKIFQLIRQHIDNSKGKKTAIIATHDIKLALNFADQIIILPEDETEISGNESGYIINSSIDNNQRKWFEIPANISPKEYIKNLMNTGKDSHDTPKKYNKINNAESYKHFREYFSKRVSQYLSIFSKDGAILIVLLFIVFSAIGFAKGGLQYLKNKMDDPFVNWIEIDIPQDKKSHLKKILYNLSQFNIKNQYFIKHVCGFYEFSLLIMTYNKKETFIVSGRTIAPSDPILSKIISKDNLVIGSSFLSDDDASLIVTEAFLKKYGYQLNDTFINMEFPIVFDKTRPVPLPIRAIVKNLPGNMSFVSTPFFYFQRYKDSANAFSPNNTRELILFNTGDLTKGFELQKEITLYFQNNNAFANYDFVICDPYPDNTTYKAGYRIYINIDPEPDLEFIEEIFTNLNKYMKHNKHEQLLKLYEHPFGQITEFDDFHTVSIYLKSLKNVEEFNRYFNSTFDMVIDMKKIERLKNYKVITNYSNTISALLIIISIISISIFIGYILYLHLFKMRVSIGTLKAFGVSDKSLRNIYIVAMLKFLTLSLAVSFFLTVVFGYTGILNLILLLFFSIDSSYIFFDMLSIQTIFILLTIPCVGYIVLWFTANKILKRSPGDLIYNRIEITRKK